MQTYMIDEFEVVFVPFDKVVSVFMETGEVDFMDIGSPDESNPIWYGMKSITEFDTEFLIASHYGENGIAHCVPALTQMEEQDCTREELFYEFARKFFDIADILTTNGIPETFRVGVEVTDKNRKLLA